LDPLVGQAREGDLPADERVVLDDDAPVRQSDEPRTRPLAVVHGEQRLTRHKPGLDLRKLVLLIELNVRHDLLLRLMRKDVQGWQGVDDGHGLQTHRDDAGQQIDEEARVAGLNILVAGGTQSGKATSLEYHPSVDLPVSRRAARLMGC